MKKIEVSHLVPAPPDAVFARASDFANAPKIISAILSVEVLTEGETGVGTRFKETRKMFGKEATEEMEVLEFVPPERYVLGARSCGCEYRSELRFLAVEGGTEVRASFAGEPQNFFAKIMAFVMAPLMKSVAKHLKGDLEDLGKSFVATGAGELVTPDPAK